MNHKGGIHKMNYKTLISIVVFFVSANLIYSQDSTKVVSRITEENIEINYLTGTESNNLGLKISAVYHLGEQKSQKAVIPLMDVLRTDSAAEARIMAALSLYKIGDQRGIFAIKKAIEFDKNEQVRKMCSIFYQMYVAEHGEAK